MKCIILLSLVALCYSYPYTTGYGYGSAYVPGKAYNVNSDGSITVTTPTGKRINISKGVGSVRVDVTYGVPIGKRYGFTAPQTAQLETLAQILGNYEGDVSQDVYQQLIAEVSDAIRAGQVPEDVNYALQTLGQVGTQQWGNDVGYVPYRQYQKVESQYQWPVYASGIQQQGLYPYANQYPQVYDTVGPYGGHIVGYTGNQGVFGTGKSAWGSLIRQVLNGNQQVGIGQYEQYKYGQPSGFVGSQLNQIVQKEREILGQQNQVHQEQLQQQQQQQHLLQEQVQQFIKQQQQQNQQEYLQQLQHEQQQQQEQLLGQQQQQYQVLNNILAGVFNRGQQTGYGQQKPYFYNQGKYVGGYGQGVHGYNTPLVF